MSSKDNEKASENTDPTTFALQDKLSRLPIPTLEETLAKFSTTVAPLLDTEQTKQTSEIVDDFVKNDGPALQNLLIDYDEKGRKSGLFGSYVEEFWNESYLAPDQSVVLNLNPFFVLEEGPDPKTSKDPIARAASLCFASLKMASLLKHELLPPDLFRGKPLCMDQFKALLGSARYPTTCRDEVYVYPESSHVAVLLQNQIYYFQALWPHTGTVAVDERDIIEILQAIQAHANEATQEDTDAFNALGILTSLPRGEWATARKEMCDANHLNKEALDVVDSALFVLVLDDHVPTSVSNMASTMLHGSHQLKEVNGELVQIGTCCSRWYDKLQIIVCGDGTAGINFEHSAIDGHTALRFVSDIYAETVVSFAQSITKLIHGAGWIPDNIRATVDRAALKLDESGRPTLDVFPKKLVFDLPPTVKTRIHYAETHLSDQIVSTDTVVLEFEEFGKSMIVANRLSPDSLVQMSIMMAYYKVYGKFVCAYEPVLTKTFYHGRTEAMRSATQEAKHLCTTWFDPGATKEAKLRALKAATAEHSRLVKECAQGKGVDRHLFALKSIAVKNGLPVPTFFSSKAWEILNHTVLSTSNCGNPSLRLFGFGPVVQDGFGIGYIIKDRAVNFAVTSHHRQTQRYANALRNTLLDIKAHLSSASEISCDDHSSNRQSLKKLPVTQHSGVESLSEHKAPRQPAAEPGIIPHKRRTSGKLFAHVVLRNSSKLEDAPEIPVHLGYTPRSKSTPILR